MKKLVCEVWKKCDAHVKCEKVGLQCVKKCAANAHVEKLGARRVKKSDVALNCEDKQVRSV